MELRKLSKKELQIIKHQLIIFENGAEYNHRDKLIFELVYEYDLSNDKIKMIRIRDLEMFPDRIIIKLPSKDCNITNEEVRQDIINTMKSFCYFTEDEFEIFEDSEYLIKHTEQEVGFEPYEFINNICDEFLSK